MGCSNTNKIKKRPKNQEDKKTERKQLKIESPYRFHVIDKKIKIKQINFINPIKNEEKENNDLIKETLNDKLYEDAKIEKKSEIIILKQNLRRYKEKKN